MPENCTAITGSDGYFATMDSIQVCEAAALASPDRVVADFTGANAVAFQKVSGVMVKTNGQVRAEGFRGPQSRKGGRVIDTVQLCSGGYELYPTGFILRELLFRIFGGTKAAPAIDGTNVTRPNPFDLCQRVGGKSQVFRNCVITSATFSSSQGGLLGLSLGIEASRANDKVTTAIPIFPTTTSPNIPIGHSQCELVLDVGGTNRKVCVYDMTFSFQWAAELDRYGCNKYRVKIPLTDYVASVNATIDLSGNEDLSDIAISTAGNGYIFGNGKADLIWGYDLDNSGTKEVSLKFSVNSLQFQNAPPDFDTATSVYLPLSAGVFAGNADAREFDITLTGA